MKIVNTAKLLFAALLVAASLVACKKDDNEDKNKLLIEFERSAAFFDYGQNRLLTFEKKNVMSITPSAPEGWGVAILDSGLSVTAPAANASNAKLSGSVTITAKDAEGNSETASIIVGVRPVNDLSAAGTANSYIVCDADTRYSIRADVKGNAVAQKITPSGAMLLWQTSKDLLQYVELVDGKIIFNTTYGAERLTPGNALIAALDDNDNILWSWHIWVTPEDPRNEVCTYPDGSTAMARNLGALSSCFDTAADTIFYTYGLLYQWGRKDPFVAGRNASSTSNAYTYDASGKSVNMKFVESSASTGTIAYAAAHPTEFIKGAEDNAYDWLFSSHDNTLWSSAKTLNDPCPAGWRVASRSLWAQFTTTGRETQQRSEFNVTDDFFHGWKFNADADATSFFPAVGRRSFANGIIANTDSSGAIGIGFYWSCEPSAEAGRSAALSFTASNVNPADSRQRANGQSIRCVRE